MSIKMSAFFYKTRNVIFLLTLLITISCNRDEDEDDSVNRTLLVYIAADNNLSPSANPNLFSMNSSIRSGTGNSNLLAFVDRVNVNPVLLHLHGNSIDTVKIYPEKNSADPAVLKEVIDYVHENYKSDSYGLVMWSHGTGWIPARQLHFVAPNLNYSPSRDGDGHHVSVLDIQRYPSSILTKTFAMENIKGANPSYVCMELDGLADAIPDGMFDFILFDACYMGNVEVAYALRKKARYIVSSAYEIVSYGFPYHLVTSDMLEGNLMKVCREFYAYYSGFSDWQQMAGISLVRTEGLDSLASCFRKIVAGKEDTIARMDIKKIQVFDRFRNHVFFDLYDVVEKTGVDKDCLDEFRYQLDRCVSFKISTPYIFYGDYEQIKVDKYCGLSVYVPISKYDKGNNPGDPVLNDDYRKTEWSITTGY